MTSVYSNKWLGVRGHWSIVNMGRNMFIYLFIYLTWFCLVTCLLCPKTKLNTVVLALPPHELKLVLSVHPYCMPAGHIQIAWLDIHPSRWNPRVLGESNLYETSKPSWSLPLFTPDAWRWRQFWWPSCPVVLGISHGFTQDAFQCVLLIVLPLCAILGLRSLSETLELGSSIEVWKCCACSGFVV